MITENIETLKIQKLTQEQLDREKAAGRIDETSIYVTDEKEAELATRLSEVDKADWAEDGVPQEWIDTEIEAGSFPNSAYRNYRKTKGSGYAYDYGWQWIRFYIEHSTGRGQYNKYVMTVNPSPVPDPDYKDWEITRDASGKIISMTPKNFMDSIPQRLANGHIRVPKDLSAYEALTGDARLMAALSYGAALMKFATKDELSAIPNVDLSEYVKSENLAKVATSGAYADLSGCPTVPSALSQLSQSASYRTVTDTEKAAWNAKSDFDGKYSSLTGKPTIPTALSQLSQTESYRTVTDTEKAAWNAKMGEGTKYYLSMGDTLETGLWYIELAGTVSHTYGRVYCPLGVVRVDAGTKIIYCPTFDRDFVLYNGGQEIAITQHNTLTNDYGGVSQVIAYKLS